MIGTRGANTERAGEEGARRGGQAPREGWAAAPRPTPRVEVWAFFSHRSAGEQESRVLGGGSGPVQSADKIGRASCRERVSSPV